ncbi:ribosomal protein S18-alanine N-acetyltransferase [Rhodococcus sp. TAF43]|jgi:[ribosomal protein S18]-alanine N-acetyltransferase|uniref:ribosomal protein S18-alanine N-acetyltransferase n=1 Tax=unclassified Rhodococcus (in: high G+C Gram-positive bacteria) TaxID=192944 RepID=UPI000E0B945E|nr:MULTISPECIES: ribosomal protein S18-alanine N-acetyltransferase [unclassified Rhodococcus (in: high G+C Gram-positive bacteria)]QKT12723.1 ribosomal protein S18-alanine N-acetyltransferase [Rhodococcus sp. W8901]RDI34022.1 ribosomal-protein-alanine N-acetyltransferase [Rhodococcus sp. AG1013]
MSIRIVPMADTDTDRCAELEQVLFPGDDPWSAQAFRSELAGGHNHYFTARDDADTLIGYAGVALLGNSVTPEAEVHTIGVDPSAQRGGIGGALLAELLRVADKWGGPVFLEVRTDNEPAIALYKREGFEIVGTRKRYYQPSGADAYTMHRPARIDAEAAERQGKE